MAIKLKENLYLSPTAKAVYQVMMCMTEHEHGTLIKNLLKHPETPRFTEAFLLDWLSTDDIDGAVKKVQELNQLGLVKGITEKRQIPDLPSDVALTECVKNLSDEGVMLANDQGFYLVNEGFEQEDADEIAAMAAELFTFHKKRVSPLVEKGLIESEVWSMLNYQGRLSLSFWPIKTASESFTLVIKGAVKFNQDSLVDLARLLMNKYQ
ncbi:MAG: hypothetical protein R3E90_13030 [Marinicella sp.]|nr:hypothetical protein [Xanthomonadales bacterium]